MLTKLNVSDGLFKEKARMEYKKLLYGLFAQFDIKYLALIAAGLEDQRIVGGTPLTFRDPVYEGKTSYYLRIITAGNCLVLMRKRVCR